MKIVLNENTSLSFNMAAEEYLMKHFKEDIFMLWRADRSVLIGSNQNTYEEIDYEYVKENKIEVVRRLSGGGTVFCDLGNTNFAFIVSDTKAFSDFRKFTGPILEVLKALGVNAEFSGRNDLTIAGKKFSGNAQYKYKDRLLHHGTLLFKSDIGDLAKAIKPKKIKYESKGIASVRSRVTNIASHLDNTIDIQAFRTLINNHIKNTTEKAEYYEFTETDLIEINKLETNRFKKWEWNYGKSPKYKASKSSKFKGGIVEANFEIIKGHINSIKFYGDFFSRLEIFAVENALKGLQHDRKIIIEKLNTFDLDQYFTNINAEEIASLFF